MGGFFRDDFQQLKWRLLQRVADANGDAKFLLISGATLEEMEDSGAFELLNDGKSRGSHGLYFF